MLNCLHLKSSVVKGLLTHLFDNALIGMAIVASDNKFILVNNAFAFMLGYTEKELEGKSIEHVTHPEDIEKSHVFITECSKQSGVSIRPLTLEKRYMTKSGKTAWGRVTISFVNLPQSSKNDGGIHTVAQIEDITNLVNLRMLLEKFRQDISNCIDE